VIETATDRLGLGGADAKRLRRDALALVRGPARARRSDGSPYRLRSAPCRTAGSSTATDDGDRRGATPKRKPAKERGGPQLPDDGIVRIFRDKDAAAGRR
jgi:hypothetical protein